MSDLFLVRHAQASFHKEDYDQLSDKGHEQSRYLARRVYQNLKPDHYISGTLKRHMQTIDPLVEIHQTQPLNQLHVNQLDGFNEFNYFDVLQQHRKEWRTKRDMMLSVQQSSHPEKTFEEHFRQALTRWISAEFDEEYQETWKGFKQRVVSALNQVMKQASSGSKTLVLTSGGPIAVICQHLLQLSDQQTFEVNAALANTGITRIKFNSERCSLHGLNDIAHLEDHPMHLITYR